jgi:Uma2 family endonuclease
LPRLHPGSAVLDRRGRSRSLQRWLDHPGGPPAHPPHDGQATTNPLVVVEVLSPSSEGDDDGDKRRDFQSLSSLQAYVLAAQDERCVKVYRRDERGAWRDEPDVYRDGDQFELPRLTRAIAVDEVYDDILDTAGQSLLH